MKLSSSSVPDEKEPAVNFIETQKSTVSARKVEGIIKHIKGHLFELRRLGQLIVQWQMALVKVL